MSESAQAVSGLLLFDTIVQDPGCLETGLCLLEADRVPDQQAYIASGVDRVGRPVVLYVSGTVIEVADVESATACARSKAEGATIGRLFVVAAGLDDDSIGDPPMLLDGWELEWLRWHVQDQPVDGETVVEISETLDNGEADPSAARTETEPSIPRLSDEEIQSLVGSWPVGMSGSRT